MSSSGDPPGPNLCRNAALRAYDHEGTITILGEDGMDRCFSDDSATLVRALLDFAVMPRSRGAMFAHVAELAGQPVEAGGVVDEAISALMAAGALREVAPVALPGRPRGRGRILLGLTGAIASMEAPAFVGQLHARGFEVRVAATRNALRFVSALALEALTHHPVCSSLWPSDARAPVPHLELAAWADLVVIHPASAASLARIAQGSCADLVSAMAISARAPVLLVPSMNERMLTAPSVRRNLEQLRDDGFCIALPAFGLEVAEEPAARRPMRGAAPKAAAVLDLIEAILAKHGAKAEGAEVLAGRWDELYRTRRPEDLPWHTEELDPDIAAVLDRARKGGSLLDLGAGLGTAAIEASKRGFMVVAADLSPRAVELGSARARGASIVWMVDDVLSSRLRMAFDVVLDRGLLHALPAASHAAYAEAAARLVAPGGRLVLKCHSTSETRDLGTHRFDERAITELFGAWFQVVSAEETTFPGQVEPFPRALLCVLERR